MSNDGDWPESSKLDMLAFDDVVLVILLKTIVDEEVGFYLMTGS